MITYYHERRVISLAHIDWHSGFSGGFHLILREYKDDLSIEREHYITKEPTRMDHLIIKKDKNVIVDNSIGRAFRGHNIIEYKNPNSALNIDVVWKAIGYAGLYKGYGETVNAIPAKELTITILRSRKPVKLFKGLKSDGYMVKSTAPGVYLLSGFIDMPIQVIVMKELADEVFRPLRIMVPDADEGEIRAFIMEAITFSTPEDQNNASAVLNVSSEANEKTFKRIRRDNVMGGAMKRIMKEDIEQAKQETTVDHLKDIMKAFGVTIEKAMDSLNIPSDQRANYINLVNAKASR